MRMKELKKRHLTGCMRRALSTSSITCVDSFQHTCSKVKAGKVQVPSNFSCHKLGNCHFALNRGGAPTVFRIEILLRSSVKLRDFIQVKGAPWLFRLSLSGA
ncbi:hypothetical protein SUGI_0146390 [Cryptomeria japonica]|nr:hypothetical protein SUGI_0146390 [Cryptomeria japonica]